MTKTNRSKNYLLTGCHSQSRLGCLTHFTVDSLAQLVVRLISFFPLWVLGEGFEKHARSTLMSLANLWMCFFCIPPVKFYCTYHYRSINLNLKNNKNLL